MDSRFEELYKSRALRFTMEQRVRNLNHHRRSSRNTLLNEVRQIPDILTPIASPTVVGPPPEDKEPKKESRLERLKKWQEEKRNRQLEQKRNSKPMFKVYHVASSTNFNLDSVYKEIKGKPIAPSSEYKFKAPSNIKPITIKSTAQESSKGAITKVANKSAGIKKTLEETTSGTSKELKGTLKSTRSNTKESKLSTNQSQTAPRSNTDVDSKLLKSRTRSGLKESITGTLSSAPEPIRKPTRSNANVDSKAPTKSNANVDSKTPTKSNVNVDSKAPTKTTSKEAKTQRSKSKETVKSNISLASKERPRRSTRSQTNVDAKNILKESRSRSNLSSVSEELTGKSTRSNVNVDSKASTRNALKQSRRSKSRGSSKSSTSTTSKASSALDIQSEPKRISLSTSLSPDYPVAANTSSTESDSPRRSKLRGSSKSSTSTTSKASSALDTQSEPKRISLSTSLSPEYPVAANTSSTESDSPRKLVTPEKRDASEVVYISPFITISRGKENSRREYHKRSRAGGSLGNTSTSPQAAAAHFRILLDNHIERFRMLCDEWNVYKEEQQPAEEVCDMINVAIGQTELLIRKKFQQFRGLVDSCENGNSEKRVTCLDLHGFWDMVMIQVNNLNKRFENLENLKMNNWEEILPVKTTRPKPKKAAAKKKKNVTGSSALRAAIQEARKKKAQQPENDDVLPVKSPASGRKSRSRQSLRTSVLINESKRLESSYVQPASKDKTPLRKRGSATNTPKSILKSEKSRKSRRQTKSVLFVGNDSDQENDANTSNNLIQFTPPSKPKLRKSLRFN